MDRSIRNLYQMEIFPSLSFFLHSFLPSPLSWARKGIVSALREIEFFRYFLVINGIGSYSDMLTSSIQSIHRMLSGRDEERRERGGGGGRKGISRLHVQCSAVLRGVIIWGRERRRKRKGRTIRRLRRRRRRLTTHSKEGGNMEKGPKWDRKKRIEVESRLGRVKHHKGEGKDELFFRVNMVAHYFPLTSLLEVCNLCRRKARKGK